MRLSTHTGTRRCALVLVRDRRPSERLRLAKLFLVRLLPLLAFLLLAQPVFAQDQAKRLVALLDYLSSDYKNAVQDGK
ncbi:MAG TPA: hypothetical protein VGK77_30205, partial [Candidatus Binatia bacterium]